MKQEIIHQLPPVTLPLKLRGRGCNTCVEDANGVEVISRTHGFKTDKAHEDWCRWVALVANSSTNPKKGTP